MSPQIKLDFHAFMAVEGAGFQDQVFKIAAHGVVDPASTVAAEMAVQDVATVSRLGEDLGLSLGKPERACRD